MDGDEASAGNFRRGARECGKTKKVIETRDSTLRRRVHREFFYLKLSCSVLSVPLWCVFENLHKHQVGRKRHTHLQERCGRVVGRATKEKVACPLLDFPLDFNKRFDPIPYSIFACLLTENAISQPNAQATCRRHVQD